MNETERRRSFEALVAQGLWIIIRLLARRHGHGRTEIEWRANAISYFDEFGNESPEAAEYRRTVGFPELPPNA